MKNYIILHYTRQMFIYIIKASLPHNIVRTSVNRKVPITLDYLGNRRQKKVIHIGSGTQVNVTFDKNVLEQINLQ